MYYNLLSSIFNLQNEDALLPSQGHCTHWLTYFSTYGKHFHYALTQEIPTEGAVSGEIGGGVECNQKSLHCEGQLRAE